jgi:hypothetical protein
MKFFLRDLVIVSMLLTIWYFLLNHFSNNNQWQYYESIKYFPLHLIISVGYYAVLNISYKILFINDCESDYSALLEQIEEGKKFLAENKII